MRAAKLSSSLIARISYVDDQRTLKVWFREGALYCYFDVPAEAYEALRDSGSAGTSLQSAQLRRDLRRED